MVAKKSSWVSVPYISHISFHASPLCRASYLGCTASPSNFNPDCKNNLLRQSKNEFIINKQKSFFPSFHSAIMANKEQQHTNTKSSLGLLIVEGGFEDQVRISRVKGAVKLMVFRRSSWRRILNVYGNRLRATS